MFNVYIYEACILVLVCSGIPLVVSSIVGVMVSIIQAATQIQEQTITYFCKLLGVGATLALLGGYFGTQLIEFMQQTIISLAYFGRS